MAFSRQEYTAYGIRELYSEIEDDIYDTTHLSKAHVKAIQGTRDEIEARNIAEKNAIVMAFDDIRNYVSEIVNVVVIESCEQTREYNFGPYIEHLLTAIDANMFDITDKAMITINIPNYDNINSAIVNVNFESLGTVDEWTMAVDEARMTMNVGGYTAQFTHKDSGEHLASRLWRDKIYRADREGGESKHKGKYTETILTRLSMLSKKRAPFWYLIEHGNTGAIEGLEEGAAFPYPVFEPTNMTDKIAKSIKSYIVQIYETYLEKAEEIIFNKLYEGWEVRGRGKTWEQLEENTRDTVDAWIRENKAEDIARVTAEGRKVLGDIIVNGEKFFVMITTRGTLDIRKRGPSGFEAIR